MPTLILAPPPSRLGPIPSVVTTLDAFAPENIIRPQSRLRSPGIPGWGTYCARQKRSTLCCVSPHRSVRCRRARPRTTRWIHWNTRAWRRVSPAAGQIVADDLERLTVLLRVLAPVLPVVLVEGDFDGEDGEVGGEALVEVTELRP